MDADHDRRGSVGTGGLEDTRGFKGGSGIKDGAGGLAGGVGVADGNRGHIVGPGVLDDKVHAVSGHVVRTDHDGRIRVDADLRLVANVGQCGERTVQAIGDVGFTDGNARDRVSVGDVIDLVGQGAGLAVFHAEVAAGVNKEIDLGVPVEALHRDGLLDGKLDGIVHHALLVEELVAELDREHPDTVLVEGLVDGNGDAVDVLGDDRDGGQEIGVGRVVSGGRLKLGFDRFLAADGRLD